MSRANDNERIEFLLSRSLDGDLTAEERRELDAALAADPSLVELLASYEDVDRTIRDAAESVPEIDWSRFEDRVRQGRAETGRSTLRWPLRLFVPLAAAAAVALMFMLVESPTEEMRSSGIVVQYDATPPSTGIVEVSYDTTETVVEEPTIAVAAIGRELHWPTPEDDPRGG